MCCVCCVHAYDCNVCVLCMYHISVDVIIKIIIIEYL